MQSVEDVQKYIEGFSDDVYDLVWSQGKTAPSAFPNIFFESPQGAASFAKKHIGEFFKKIGRVKELYWATPPSIEKVVGGFVLQMAFYVKDKNGNQVDFTQ